MEKDLILTTSDKKKIYGRMRGVSKDFLVILVHGLCGHMDEYQFYNAARYFEKRKMSAFRFNLYDWKKGARTLNECSFDVHAADIDFLVSRFKKQGYKKVFVVGHSFGGPSILHSKKKQFDGAIFWDPSFDEKLKWFDDTDISDNKKTYMQTWAYSVEVPRIFIEQIRLFKPTQIIQTLNKPTLFVTAGKGVLQRVRKTFEAACAPKELRVIKNAGHSFQEDGTAEELYKVTGDWVSKIAKL